ncbi:hypothetical protein CBR_g53542 [Chara braunii]|uniref:Dihydroorotate dehydrogenase (quinone), mitochondrial n=1 Tax=Chara braunii TaxID=69332 RepID=A0A388MAX6_CHABU|nr:hypothetical protein CBR_g53542 [Chara braunii]|eukprot:GBG91727.1 hypothetical protein CBR_g53542 [Chara braunii]
MAGLTPPYTPTDSELSEDGMPWRQILGGSFLGSIVAGGAYFTARDRGTLSDLYFKVSRAINPLWRFLPPERAHRFTVLAAKYNLVPREYRMDPSCLHVDLWGRHFNNPIGLAAGFDKSAEGVDGLLGMGFGAVEIGSVTPVPQAGNPGSRLFRLPEQQAVINRYGFNNEGIEVVSKRLAECHKRRRRVGKRNGVRQGGGSVQKHGLETGIIGVNLGKNKKTEDAAADFEKGVRGLAQYADYLVINVSSPNTPGLRNLQGREQLQALIKRVLDARNDMQWGEETPPPVLVKVSPDLTEEDMEDIAAVVIAEHVEGLIVSNTTIKRPKAMEGLPGTQVHAGLSGRPLLERSNEVLRDMYRLTEGKIPIIGCGGISSGEDAYVKIRAGASLVQLCTAFMIEGPPLVPRIKRELAALLERDGFKSVSEAVGIDHR